MQIHSKLVDLIILRREPYLGSLLVGVGNLDLESLRPNLSQLLNELDKIFYTLNFLEKEKLISIAKHDRYERVTILNDFTVFEREEDAIFGQAYYYHLLGDTGKALSWQIEMRPGLLAFKDKGYLTDEAEKDSRNFWLAIIIAVGSPLLTVILQKCFK